MGYQLEQVCKKRSVKKVTLIEKDQEIVDWIFPRLDLNDKEVDVIIGDAEELLLDMTADVALIDIYKGYGGNGDGVVDRIRRSKDGEIGKVWVWGSANIG
jgi:spermidine synthase